MYYNIIRHNKSHYLFFFYFSTLSMQISLNVKKLTERHFLDLDTNNFQSSFWTWLYLFNTASTKTVIEAFCKIIRIWLHEGDHCPHLKRPIEGTHLGTFIPRVMTGACTGVKGSSWSCSPSWAEGDTSPSRWRFTSRCAMLLTPEQAWTNGMIQIQKINLKKKWRGHLKTAYEKEFKQHLGWTVFSLSD